MHYSNSSDETEDLYWETENPSLETEDLFTLSECADSDNLYEIDKDRLIEQLSIHVESNLS